MAGSFAGNLRTEGFTLQAVGARDGGRAREFADRYGIATAHEGYDALVNDPTVDVVYVNTTHNLHAEHALLAALEATTETATCGRVALVGAGPVTGRNHRHRGRVDVRPGRGEADYGAAANAGTDRGGRGQPGSGQFRSGSFHRISRGR